MLEVIVVKDNFPDVLEKIKIIKTSMKAQDVVINLENERFKGNVLDIGMDNYGVIYQMCKNNDDDLNVEYIDKEGERNNIEKQWYDTAVLFFCLGKLNTNISKKKLLKEIYEYLRDDGEIRIWDIDKCSMSAANLKVKVLLPKRKVKNIVIKDFNIAKDRSKENIKKLLKPMFEIIEIKTSNNIYYIKGRKIKKGMT